MYIILHTIGGNTTYKIIHNITYKSQEFQALNLHTHTQLEGCSFPTLFKNFSLSFKIKISIKNGKKYSYYFDVFLEGFPTTLKP